MVQQRNRRGEDTDRTLKRQASTRLCDSTCCGRCNVAPSQQNMPTEKWPPRNHRLCRCDTLTQPPSPSTELAIAAALGSHSRNCEDVPIEILKILGSKLQEGRHDKREHEHISARDLMPRNIPDAPSTLEEVCGTQANLRRFDVPSEPAFSPNRGLVPRVDISLQHQEEGTTSTPDRGAVGQALTSARRVEECYEIGCTEDGTWPATVRKTSSINESSNRQGREGLPRGKHVPVPQSGIHIPAVEAHTEPHRLDSSSTR